MYMADLRADEEQLKLPLLYCEKRQTPFVKCRARQDDERRSPPEILSIDGL